MSLSTVMSLSNVSPVQLAEQAASLRAQDARISSVLEQQQRQELQMMQIQHGLQAGWLVAARHGPQPARRRSVEGGIGGEEGGGCERRGQEEEGEGEWRGEGQEMRIVAEVGDVGSKLLPRPGTRRCVLVPTGEEERRRGVAREPQFASVHELNGVEGGAVVGVGRLRLELEGESADSQQLLSALPLP